MKTASLRPRGSAAIPRRGAAPIPAMGGAAAKRHAPTNAKWLQELGIPCCMMNSVLAVQFGAFEYLDTGAAIWIASNAADENPFDLQLTGAGLDRVAPFQGSRRIASTVNADDELAIGMSRDNPG